MQSTPVYVGETLWGVRCEVWARSGNRIIFSHRTDSRFSTFYQWFDPFIIWSTSETQFALIDINDTKYNWLCKWLNEYKDFSCAIWVREGGGGVVHFQFYIKRKLIRPWLLHRSSKMQAERNCDNSIKAELQPPSLLPPYGLTWTGSQVFREAGRDKNIWDQFFFSFIKTHNCLKWMNW